VSAPNVSMTTRAGIPCDSIIVAAQCLRSWNRWSRSPALFSERLKFLVTLSGSMGVPTRRAMVNAVCLVG
jgi:hypothetical protein